VQHPALLVEPEHDTQQEVLTDHIVRADRVQAGPHPVGEERDPRVEERQHVLIAQLTRRERLQRRAGGYCRDPSVGGDADGGEALGHFVVPVAVLVGEFVKEEMDRPEARANEVPVGLLGLQAQVDEFDEGCLE